MDNKEKKIYVFDFLAPENHKRLYVDYITALSMNFFVIVYTKKNYFIDEFSENNKISIQDLYVHKGARNRLTRFMRNIYVLHKTRKVFNRIVENKLILTFDTVSFAYSNLILNLHNTYVMHHKNIDELENKVKRTFFKTYMNKVNHIIFEELFAQRLIGLGVSKSKINVVPHSIHKNQSESISQEYSIVGLSNSIDDEFISSMISFEKENSYFMRKKIKILMRSKKLEFNNGFLNVVNGRLSDIQYNELIEKTKYMFIQFPPNFNNRVSGALFDGISKGKRIISNRNALVSYYDSRYPSLFTMIENIQDISIVLDSNGISNSDSFEAFYKDHSIEKIKNDLFRIFGVN